MRQETIGFIGGGNMAEGIIKGVVADKAFAPENIHVYDILPQRMDLLHERYGTAVCADAAAAAAADVVVFAVRPQDVDTVCPQVAPYLKETSVFVSICAGVTMAKFAGYLGEKAKIVRVMPNTLTETHHGYSAVCRNGNTSAEDAAPVTAMLEAIGQVMEINESAFDTFTAYSCTGPAYLLYLMGALTDAGVRSGFSRAQSRAMTIENMIGTAMKLEQTGLHPGVILDTMTSPAGVGIEAICTMKKHGVSGAVMDSVGQAVKKANSLG